MVHDGQFQGTTAKYKLDIMRYCSEGYTYLGPDVLVAWRTDEGKADQKHIGLRI